MGLYFDLDKINAERMDAFADWLDGRSAVLMSLQRQPACESPVRDLGGWMNDYARQQMGRETELSISQSVADWYGLSADTFYGLQMAQGRTYKVVAEKFDTLHCEMRKHVFVQVVRKARQTAGCDWYSVVRGVVALPNINQFIQWNKSGMA